MAVMDEFKEERESIKTAPFKKKVEYFWDYYKIHTIVVIAVLLIVGSLAQTYLTKKETVLYAAMVSGYASEDIIADLETEFMELIDADTKQYEAFISTSIYLDYETEDTNHMYGLQALVTLVASSEIDVFVSEELSFVTLAYSEMFMNLEEYLTEEELEQYEGKILYVDQAIIDEVDELNNDNVDDSEYPECVYSTNPDEMEEPIAVGIYGEETSTMSAEFYGGSDTVIVGIIANSTRVDNAVEYIGIILE